MLSIILLALGILLIIHVIYENKNLSTEYYTVTSEKIPQSFQGHKFVVLADLHNNSYGPNNNRLLDAIYKVNPSFIIIAGDMLVAGKAYKDEVSYALIKELSKKYPIYYGYGNHEQRIITNDGPHYHDEFNQYKEKLEDLGVTFLYNRTEEIYKGKDAIHITGLALDNLYFKKGRITPLTKEDVEKLVGISNNQCYNILIAHNPVYFEQYALWGADITLSGHLHGGIMGIPYLGGFISPQYTFFPKYCCGLYKYKNKVLLVSRGLGMHTIKIRINNRPELMVVTLQHQEC